MGRPIDQRTVRAYADSFKKFPCLKTRGFSVLMNVSGKLFMLMETPRWIGDLFDKNCFVGR